MSTPEPSPPPRSEQLETCATRPLGRTLRLLGDAPTLLIVYTLLRGTHRFGELRTALGDVSPKTISQRLRLLEELGFVEREAFAEIPPRVEYHLTEKGLALVDIMAAIKQFGERYLSDDGASGPCDTSQAPTSPDSHCDQPACR
jgi:DNA-binding HxlR family transcriptional regulator